MQDQWPYRLGTGGNWTMFLYNLEVVTLCTVLGTRGTVQVPWLRYCTVCFIFLLFFPFLFNPSISFGHSHCSSMWKKWKDKRWQDTRMLTHSVERSGQVGLTSSPRSVDGQGDALGKGSGRCELQVGLSSTSLLALATLVSHEMQWHQIFNEHAAKKEEWCPPGQRAGTLNRSSAGKKQTQHLKTGYFQLQVERVCLTFIFLPPWKKQKVHPCAFWQRQWKWGKG